jgi:hypothetical protein
MERRVVAGLSAVALLAVLAAAVLSRDPDSPGPPTPPPSPAPVAPPSPAPIAVRVALPPPADVDPPAVPEERPADVPITPDDRRAMNYAVDDVLKEAEAQCLEPWLARLPERPGRAEFVFDALLFDGQLADIGMRSLTVDVPADVVSCVADAAWYADWPSWDLRGELRLQRSFDVVAPP